MQPVEAKERRSMIGEMTEKFFQPSVRKVLYPPEFHRRRLKRRMSRGEFG